MSPIEELKLQQECVFFFNVLPSSLSDFQFYFVCVSSPAQYLSSGHTCTCDEQGQIHDKKQIDVRI